MGIIVDERSVSTPKKTNCICFLQVCGSVTGTARGLSTFVSLNGGELKGFAVQHAQIPYHPLSRMSTKDEDV
jgi:hypothetical protein